MEDEGESLPLRPWPGDASLPVLVLCGRWQRQGEHVSLSYILRGELDYLELPSPVTLPERRQLLWLESCFEFFFAPVGEDGYWEGNVTPAGHWNCYHFNAYRRGMHEFSGVPRLPARQRRTATELHLDLDLDLGCFRPPGTLFRLGLAAVLRTRTAQLSYWALRHPGSLPDFHHSESFLLTV